MWRQKIREGDLSETQCQRGVCRIFLSRVFRRSGVPHIGGVFEAGEHVFRWNAGAEFQHFDVFRFDEWFEGSPINHSTSRRAMVASRKLHVMDMKPVQPG